MMKKRFKNILLALICAVSGGSMLLVGGTTLAVFERYAKVVGNDGNNIPLQTAGHKNTSLYVVPSAWNHLLSGGSSLANCYIACCMFKNDDSQYEWQFIRTCDSGKALISENRTTIEVNSTSYNAYRFSLDLTYYDRFSVLRIVYTDALGVYMESVKDRFTSKSTDARPVPLDWRNRDQDPAYARYDATHRQTKPATSNVFQITSTESGGSYGFLAWGTWMADTIVE